MNIPYRTRRALRRTGLVFAILLLVAIVVWMCWVVWLERYVVYSDDGAELRWELSAQIPEGELAQPPAAEQTIGIYYNEGSNIVDVSTELVQMAGYYANTEALADIPAVREQIMTLSTDVPVLLDVKNVKGAFYYSSSVGGTRADAVDTEAMDSLIADLAKSNRYLIARLPALRDWEFGLNNVDCGLFLPSGMGLWMDDDGCYWLDPTATGTTTYLMRIVTELEELGFDEVVFTDFCFPDGDYTFDGDRTEAITTAAATLVNTLSTDSFAVSFQSGSTSFPLPEGRSRLYLSGIDASDAQSAATETGIAAPDIYLVFLADSNDTRFDAYSVLRPMSAAH